MAPKSLCLTTAFAPVPAFLGGSCPLGCSLSAPATGGFSVVSPQYIRYAAGSEKEKRAGGRLHGGTIAHPFVFCKGGGRGPGLRRPPADGDGWSCLGLRRPSAEGLAWPAPLSRPHHPPTFLETGGLPLYPRRGLRPLPPAWRDEEGTVVPPSPPSNAFGNRGTHHTPAEATPPAPCVGTAGGQGRFLTFPRVRGQGQRRPGGLGRGGWDRCEARSSAVRARS